MKRRPQLSAEEGGDAPLTHFPRRPPSGPRPAPPRPRGSPSPAGANERGVGGPHAPHPQPRPGGKRARGLTPPRGEPGPGETSRRHAARDCWAPPPSSTARGLGAPRPPAEKGTEEGKSCKQPQRPGLASKRPASEAPPRAARALSPPRGHPSRGPGDRRGVRPAPWRAPAPRGAVPAAEKGEVRTYLSLLSTPSWIHLSTSPQSIMGKKEPLK